MSSPAITTVMKMMETLPPNIQEQIVDHLQEYLADLNDEQQWQANFARTESSLIAAAKKAKQEIAAGLAQPMDYDQL